MRVVALARKELKDALLMGGVDEVFTAQDGLEAYRILKELHEEGDADIILVERSLAERLGMEKITEMKIRKTLPLIVVMETDAPLPGGY